MACNKDNGPAPPKNFDVEKDVPDLSGKVCMVTGANGGLGKQTVLDLAKHNPSEIYLTARSADKAKEAILDIQREVPNSRITFLQLDLNSLASVKSAAKTVLASSYKLDILILNAGIMMHPPGLTGDGYETQFGTNHVSQAILTLHLLPILQRSPDPRVVVVASDLLTSAPSEGIVFSALKTTQEEINTRQRYGQSKLANLLFAKGLARHYPKLTVASVHPGIYRTGLQSAAADSSVMIRSAQKVLGGLLPDASKGTRNQLWAATSKDVRSGEYYTPVGKPGNAPKKWAESNELIERLWDWTVKEAEPYKIAEEE